MLNNGSAEIRLTFKKVAEDDEAKIVRSRMRIKVLDFLSELNAVRRPHTDAIHEEPYIWPKHTNPELNHSGEAVYRYNNEDVSWSLRYKALGCSNYNIGSLSGDHSLLSVQSRSHTRDKTQRKSQHSDESSSKQTVSITTAERNKLMKDLALSDSDSSNASESAPPAKKERVSDPSVSAKHRPNGASLLKRGESFTNGSTANKKAKNRPRERPAVTKLSPPGRKAGADVPTPTAGTGLNGLLERAAVAVSGHVESSKPLSPLPCIYQSLEAWSNEEPPALRQANGQAESRRPHNLKLQPVDQEVAAPDPPPEPKPSAAVPPTTGFVHPITGVMSSTTRLRERVEQLAPPANSSQQMFSALTTMFGQLRTEGPASGVCFGGVLMVGSRGRQPNRASLIPASAHSPPRIACTQERGVGTSPRPSVHTLAAQTSPHGIDRAAATDAESEPDSRIDQLLKLLNHMNTNAFKEEAIVREQRVEDVLARLQESREAAGASWASMSSYIRVTSSSSGHVDASEEAPFTGFPLANPDFTNYAGHMMRSARHMLNAAFLYESGPAETANADKALKQYADLVTHLVQMENRIRRGESKLLKRCERFASQLSDTRPSGMDWPSLWYSVIPRIIALTRFRQISLRRATREQLRREVETELSGLGLSVASVLQNGLIAEKAMTELCAKRELLQKMLRLVSEAHLEDEMLRDWRRADESCRQALTSLRLEDSLFGARGAARRLDRLVCHTTGRLSLPLGLDTPVGLIMLFMEATIEKHEILVAGLCALTESMKLTVNTGPSIVAPPPSRNPATPAQRSTASPLPEKESKKQKLPRDRPPKECAPTVVNGHTNSEKPAQPVKMKVTPSKEYEPKRISRPKDGSQRRNREATRSRSRGPLEAATSDSDNQESTSSPVPAYQPCLPRKSAPSGLAKVPSRTSSSSERASTPSVTASGNPVLPPAAGKKSTTSAATKQSISYGATATTARAPDFFKNWVKSSASNKRL